MHLCTNPNYSNVQREKSNNSGKNKIYKSPHHKWVLFLDL